MPVIRSKTECYYFAQKRKKALFVVCYVSFRDALVHIARRAPVPLLRTLSASRSPDCARPFAVRLFRFLDTFSAPLLYFPVFPTFLSCSQLAGWLKCAPARPPFWLHGCEKRSNLQILWGSTCSIGQTRSGFLRNAQGCVKSISWLKKEKNADWFDSFTSAETNCFAEMEN